LPELNPQQKAAIQYISGPLLVLAGAGSGKTSVITRKIAWLVREHGLAPRNITAVTFTNKAAREMKTRVGDLLDGGQARELSISTFHTLGVNILRSHLAEAGRRKGFSIYDSDDSEALIGKLASGRKQAKGAIDALRWQISRWKNELVAPEAATASVADEAGLAAARIYAEYERHLQAYNAFDFDDLILKPLRLFQTSPAILEQWRDRIRYLLVDEYQDTNLCQYELVKLLAGTRRALTVVGDDDQSIYGWRGAHPENLKLLATDFPNLRVIRLEQNYRSTSRILKAANHLIAHNLHLYEKKLWGDNGVGDLPCVLRARNEEHEAERVVAALMHHKFRHNTEYRDYAILFRENHQARVLERALRDQRIPYSLSGASSFFDRTEVKDILAYLKLLCNPRDDTAFLRAVNTPRREIGPATIEALAGHAARLGASLLEAARDPGLSEHLAARSLAALRQFTVWIEGLAERATQEAPARVINDLLEEMGYAQWLRDTSNDQKIAQMKMENVLELVDWVRRLAGRDDNGTLADAVSRLILLGMLDPENGDSTSDGVALMTLHSAKGLEFPHVYIVGMEEGILPHRNSVEPDEKGIAEERRLAYVGITRARKTLTFSVADTRRRGGEVVVSAPSRFLSELPEGELIWEESASGAVTPQRADQHLQNIRALLNATP
jgi:ATP-dependent DNA helicase Rep